MGEENNRQVCLITGGTSGVGLATAELFAQRGFDVCIGGRDSQRLSAAQTSIQSHGGRCETVAMDLAAEADQAGRLVEQTMDAFGRLDVLVNNAAVAPLAPFADLTAEQIETTINLNHRAVLYLTQAAWPIFLQQQNGIVVNISSLAAVDPFPGFSIYGASKAWIDLLTHALAAEGREHQIRVYSIRPGAVETPLLRRLFPDFPADQAVSPQQVAEKVWKVCDQFSLDQSGQAFEVSNQV